MQAHALIPDAGVLMPSHQKYEAEWEGFKLVVDARAEFWQVFVYDPAQCEVLYSAERMSMESAKLAAVDFVAVTQFGPRHNLKADVIAEMLAWEPL